MCNEPSLPLIFAISFYNKTFNVYKSQFAPYSADGGFSKLARHHESHIYCFPMFPSFDLSIKFDSNDSFILKNLCSDSYFSSYPSHHPCSVSFTGSLSLYHLSWDQVPIEHSLSSSLPLSAHWFFC